LRRKNTPSKKPIEEVWDKGKEKDKPEVVDIPPRKVERKQVPNSQGKEGYDRRNPKTGTRK
jgi:hypothetical protein